MLTESDVISATCRYLRERGFLIEQQLAETERGDDILAVLPNSSVRVVIEAKGETSSMRHTARFGKPFSSGQVLDHVAKAFFRAASARGPNTLSGVAFPGNQHHRACVSKIAEAMRLLSIEVFWVSGDKAVSCEGWWPESANNALDQARGNQLR